MIASDRKLRKVCRNYEQVENYEKAVADEEIWDLHHRREIDENKSSQQLKDEGRYYNLDPSELIFLTHAEHTKLHNENALSETRKKLSEANSGENNPMFGKQHREDSRKKMSEAKKGRVFPKISKASVERNSGRFWWNNGTYNKFSKECPGEDFVRGRLKFNK